MSTYRMLLPRRLHDQMLEHARRELPNECCGILAGVLDSDRAVARALGIFPLVNELASPSEYRSEPMSMFRAHKAIRAAPWELLAIYHSHPKSEPIPSRKDRADNYSPDVMNFILSMKETCPRIRAWWLTAEDHRPAEWELTDDS